MSVYYKCLRACFSIKSLMNRLQFFLCNHLQSTVMYLGHLELLNKPRFILGKFCKNQLHNIMDQKCIMSVNLK